MSSDAALGLLRSLVDTALDPSYHEAAQQRADAESPEEGDQETRHSSGQRPMSNARRISTAVVLLVAAATTVTGAIALRQINAGSSLQRQELRQRAESQVIATDKKASTVQDLRAEIARASAGLGSAAATDSAVPQSAGLVPLQGSGIRLVLADAATTEKAQRAGDERLSRVLDTDLQSVVNALWAAGAQGVAINGQRLTSLSAIRSAGDAILVNYRPLSGPYTVEAVGPQQQLADGLTTSPAWADLQAAAEAYGIEVDQQSASVLRLPAGEAVLRYSRVVKGGAP
ncbi:MAG TPA: hypothetical protein DHW34_00780 [Actinobacteria bacterium]|nr:hypothetical protein [Actinomycetota bacterium]